MRSLVATMVIVALASPAYAQLSPGGAPGSTSSDGRPGITLGGGIKSKTEDELSADKARDDAYKAGVAKIPAQKAKSDPWGSVRSAAPAPKPTAQKPAPK
jgi:hypothetical protein